MIGPSHPKETHRQVEARARPFEKALAIYMTRMANRVARPTLEELMDNPDSILKVDKAEKQEARDLFLRFGVRQLADSARRIGGREVPYNEILRAVDERDLQLPSMKTWWTETIIRADDFAVNTEQGIKDWIKTQVKRAHELDTRPSHGEVARVIRAGINAPPGQQTAGNMGVISYGRAGVIARTELLIGENTGIYGAMEAIDAEWLEWLAFVAPIFERRHDLMNRVRVKMGELFQLPSGAKMRYPGDPRGPVGEIVNCRCTFRGVRKRK